MRNILIIEDDNAIRSAMASLLELEGYSTVLASNGKQGMDLINAGHLPDIILLDLMMPTMNGWDFLDFIRAHGEASEIPIIVVSAYGESAKSVRPHAVVPKPIQVNSLLETIHNAHRLSDKIKTIH